MCEIRYYIKQIDDLYQVVDRYKEARHIVAKDIMAPAPICIDVNDGTDQIMRVMIERNLHVLPVLSDGKLAGILTRSDFIRCLARGF